PADLPAVGQIYGRRAARAETLRELLVLLERGLALAVVLRNYASHQHVIPSLDPVLGAPYRFRLVHRVRREDRPQKGVDGDVVDFRELLLKRLAIAAVRVLEGIDRALAVAPHPFDGGRRRLAQ